MRRVAAAIVIALAGPAMAEEDDAQVIQFSGRDGWRDGVLVYTGLLLAPGGFQQDGFMLRLLSKGGAYRYWRGAERERIIGYKWQAQALPGVRIKRGNAEMKFFIGPEWQQHWLSPDDLGNKLRGQNFGLRFAAELWAEPAPGTLIAGDLSLGTVDTSQSARLAVGWRIGNELFGDDSFYLGPEAQVYGSDGYRQFRVGLHLTTMKTEDVEWSAAIGYTRDSDGRASPYFRLSLSQPLGF